MNTRCFYADVTFLKSRIPDGFKSLPNNCFSVQERRERLKRLEKIRSCQMLSGFTNIQSDRPSRARRTRSSQIPIYTLIRHSSLIFRAPAKSNITAQRKAPTKAGKGSRSWGRPIWPSSEPPPCWASVFLDFRFFSSPLPFRLSPSLRRLFKLSFEVRLKPRLTHTWEKREGIQWCVISIEYMWRKVIDSRQFKCFNGAQSAFGSV